MSKILKGSFVTIDTDNVINVDVPDGNWFNTGIAFEPEEEPPLTEEEALSEAERIIKQAEETAEKITQTAKDEGAALIAEMKEQAEKEIEELKEQARTEAYEAGKAEGEAEKERIIKEGEWEKSQAIIEKNKTLNSAEPEIVELIADITKKLIGEAYEIKPDIILYLVKQGLSATTVAGDITIRVCEADYEAVLNGKPELAALGEAGTRLEIIKDETLNPSDCILETSYGNIDCSLNQQMDGLFANLKFIFNAERRANVAQG